MKYEYFLIRTSNGGFALARGHRIEDGSIAIVRRQSQPLQFDEEFSIIDVASGLCIIRGQYSKKKLLERWEEFKKKDPVLISVERCRSKDIYKGRVEELNEEKRIWRQSAYEVQ